MRVDSHGVDGAGSKEVGENGDGHVKGNWVKGGGRNGHYIQNDRLYPHTDLACESVIDRRQYEPGIERVQACTR